jgi:2-polyprenyl-3-methyl-5-hydroxy-6-metoxy-1,4-benzoquinol methylase
MSLPRYIKFFKENRTEKQALDLYKLRIKDSNDIYKKFSKNFLFRKCPVCGFNKKLDLEKFNKRYGVVSCIKCNSLYVNPAPSSKALNYYYNNAKCNNEKYLGKILNRRFGKKNLIASERSLVVLKLIKKMLKKKNKINVLEVGSHSGSFLHELTNQLSKIKLINKVELIGIDIDKNAIKRAVSKNITLKHASLEDFLKNNKKRFDIILHFELIEHLLDPFKFCLNIYRLLKKKGLMYFHTPNALGFDNVALPYNHVRPLAHGIFPPMHLNAFTTQNMTYFLIRAGFKVKSIDTPGNFDVDIVKQFVKKNNKWSMIKYIKNNKILAIIQSFIRYSFASSHMSVLAEK